MNRLAQRLARLEDRQRRAFVQWLQALPPAESLTWMLGVARDLAARGLWPPLPENLPDLPLAERVAYCAQVEAALPGMDSRVSALIIWEHWRRARVEGES